MALHFRIDENCPWCWRPIRARFMMSALGQNRTLGNLPNITFTPGGITLMIDKEAIDGIGVGGAPGGNFDDECAQHAIAKIRDRMR
jgi:uncharacterized protein GlcG (DUF336 family)